MAGKKTMIGVGIGIVFSLACCMYFMSTMQNVAAESGDAVQEENAMRGFVLDVSPLIGTAGRISAVAPGGAAFCGSMRFSRDETGLPYVWNREEGLNRLEVAANCERGIALAISDDGRVAAGLIYCDEEGRIGSGAIWRTNVPAIFTANEFDVGLVYWRGVSWDGSRAAGKCRWDWIRGFTVDTPAHYAIIPGANVFDPHKWEIMPTTKRRDGSIPDDAFIDKGELAAMSRDGSTFAFFDRTTSWRMDSERRKVQELLVAGLSPNDKKTPVLRKGAPDNPFSLKEDVLLASVKVSALNLDGGYAVGLVTVFYPSSPRGDAADTERHIFIGNMDTGPREEVFVVRWDKDGQAEMLLRGRHYVEDVRLGKDYKVESVSDDGKTVLLNDTSGGYFLWREGRGVASFENFLAEYGLSLPPGRDVAEKGRHIRPGARSLVMSPDGRCFGARTGMDQFLNHPVLICAGEEISPPSFLLPAE